MPSHLSRRFPIPANNVEHVLIRSAYKYVEAILESQAISIVDPSCFLEIQKKILSAIIGEFETTTMAVAKGKRNGSLCIFPAPCPGRRDIPRAPHQNRKYR
jgi:hypothetical protein